jgi:hypothetical protein
MATQTITVTNLLSSSIPGPINIALDDLTSGVTLELQKELARGITAPNARYLPAVHADHAPSALKRISGTTNGHAPSTDASSTAEHNRRTRTVRNNNRQDNNRDRKTPAPAEESGIR